MDSEVLEDLIDSHDELIKVCQATFALLIENELLDKLDCLLFVAEISPGFSERAEKARKAVMRERIMSTSIC